MSKMELAVNEGACTSCIKKIKSGLRRRPGIQKVDILHGRAKLLIHFNEDLINTEQIWSYFHKLAFRAFD